MTKKKRFITSTPDQEPDAHDGDLEGLLGVENGGVELQHRPILAPTVQEYQRNLRRQKAMSISLSPWQWAAGTSPRCPPMGALLLI
jgi:hypothetical protein